METAGERIFLRGYPEVSVRPMQTKSSRSFVLDPASVLCGNLLLPALQLSE